MPDATLSADNSSCSGMHITRHISYILAAVISLTAAFSCSKSEMEPSVPETDVFSASGIVHVDDANSANPPTIRGIRVVMSSYDIHDILKLRPIEKDTTYTDKLGRYESSLELRRNRYYDILAEDIDGKENGGEFEPYLMDKIYPGKHSRLENILLYMKRK